MGPTPSTSVALIILYSVTGIITALFLLIIVTGAIRAHRHPERYGPRATGRFGRPRQSRAKGLARAVLDTIPIVRFGAPTHEIDKTPDVEMRDPDDASMTNEPVPQQAGNKTPATNATDTTKPAAPEPSATAEERSEEAAPGTQQEHSTTTTTITTADSAAVTGLEGQNQCPVCMDDFEQGQEVRVLPCKHNFHPDCIDPWLLNVSGSCPLCRIDLHPENEQAEENETASDVPQSPPPAAQRDNNHHHHSRLSRYLDIARGTTSGDERMAALRQLREENRARSSRSHRMSQRLSRALSRRPPSQQMENSNTTA